MLFFLLIANNQKDGKPNPPPAQRNIAEKQEIKRPANAPVPAVGSSPIMLPLRVTGNTVNTVAPALTTVTPQPVIVNNQVFCGCAYMFAVDIFVLFFQ